MRCSIIFVLLAIIFGRTLSMYSRVGSVQNGRIEVESEEDVPQLGGYFFGDLKPVLDYLAILEGRVAQQSEEAASKFALVDETLTTLRTQMRTQQLENISQASAILSIIGEVDEKLETLKTQMATQEQLEKNSQRSEDALSKIVLMDEKLETLRNQTATHHEVEKSSKQSEDALSKIVLVDEKLETLKTQMATQEQLEKNSQQSEIALSKIVLVDEKLETLRNQTATQHELGNRAQRPAVSERLDNFEKFGSKYYYIEHDIKMNWDDALKKCRQMGAHLANIQSAEEMLAVYIRSWSYSKGYYWIDLNDREKEGEFVSATTGLKGNFFHWDENEPNDKDNSEDCVELYLGWMNDQSCNDENYFICERSHNFD